MPWLKNKQILSKLQHWFTPQRSNNHRPKILHPESLVVLAFAAIGFFSLIQSVRLFPSLENSILGFSSTITIDQVVTQTNERRKESGLQPLTLNSRLSAAALAKAQDMLDNQYWAHTSPQGRQPWDFMKAANYRYKIAGENLARDFQHTHDMVAAWMASPTHKANVINSQYEEIGVAVVNGRLEGFETTLVVQMFGTPTGQPAAISQASSTEQSQELTPVQQDEVAPTHSQSNDIHNPLLAVEQDSEPVESQHDEEDDSTPSAVVETIEADPLSESQFSSDGLQKVAANTFMPLSRLGESPLFTPLQITKIFFIGIILMIVITLSYDLFVIDNRKTMRLVGENLGHLILLTCIAFLMILFKGGVIK